MLKLGRVAMTDAELAYLRECVRNAGSYIEFGTLWGGSAIAAALANPKLRVTCVDPFNGYYGDEYDPYTGEKPTVSAFWDNCRDAGVIKRVRLVRAKSYPYPIDPEERFDVGLIDGEHGEEAIIHDIENLYPRCALLLAHDVDRQYVMDTIWRAGYGVPFKIERLGKVVKN